MNCRTHESKMLSFCFKDVSSFPCYNRFSSLHQPALFSCSLLSMLSVALMQLVVSRETLFIFFPCLLSSSSVIKGKISQSGKCSPGIHLFLLRVTANTHNCSMKLKKQNYGHNIIQGIPTPKCSFPLQAMQNSKFLLWQHSLPFLLPAFWLKKTSLRVERGWRKDAVVSSTYCSSWGSEFNSQYPHQVVDNWLQSQLQEELWPLRAFASSAQTFPHT